MFPIENQVLSVGYSVFVRCYFFEIVLEFCTVLMEDFDFCFFVVFVIENNPMVLHKLSKFAFEVGVDDNFLQSIDVLIE
jgi:hypothetical protein